MMRSSEVSFIGIVVECLTHLIASTTAIEDAITAERTEKDLTSLQALRAYPQAVFWSFCVSLCLIMEGYDTTREIMIRVEIVLMVVVLGNLLALPAFRKHFGHLTKSGYQLEPAWQSAIGYAPTIGAILGIFISSYFQDRYGYRRVIQANLILVTAFIFIVFFSTSIEMLFIGEVSLLCLPALII
jgi:SP family general alpha glucoside:H+ symporter-like MFS transporter